MLGGGKISRERERVFLFFSFPLLFLFSKVGFFVLFQRLSASFLLLLSLAFEGVRERQIEREKGKREVGLIKFCVKTLPFFQKNDKQKKVSCLCSRGSSRGSPLLECKIKTQFLNHAPSLSLSVENNKQEEAKAERHREKRERMKRKNYFFYLLLTASSSSK